MTAPGIGGAKVFPAAGAPLAAGVLGAFLTALRARLTASAEIEARHLGLWTPVVIGAGAIVYFGLKFEPPVWAGVAVLAAALLGAFRDGAARWPARAILAAALGFLAADIRTSVVAAPVLESDLPPRAVVGRLVSVDEAPDFRRLVIAVDSIDGLAPEALPRRIRINWRGDGFDVAPGDLIALRAALAPPPAPEVPGGFDYARMLFFQGIGAVGYAVTAPTRLDGGRPGLAARAGAAVERARLAVTRRILEAAPGQGGAMVAATVTGYRGAISREAELAFIGSGLAHLVAISGLNMALATGLIFFAVRALLAAIEPVALRCPIKKWAAAAALVSGFLYLLLSGAEWSALRAFIMTAIVFVAIIVDRRAISLRNVAVAGVLILFISPEAVTHPGFQMSFAAVTALIAFYEWASARADPNRSFSAIARARRYMAGVAATDVVAASATAPFSLYHFNQAALYSLPANILAIPVMGFWVMPAAVIGLILMPMGLDSAAWRVAAAGVDVILVIARSVASLPGAVATITQWPPEALGVLTIGGLWLCLNTAPWRLAGLAAVPIAAVFIAMTPPPDVFVSREGTNAGVRTEWGLALAFPRRDRFAARIWKETLGLDPENDPTLALADAGRCDAEGCVAVVEGAKVSFITDPLALADDCVRADLVIAFFPVSDRRRAACAARLIDRSAVWNEGAHAAWIGEEGAIRIRTVGEARGKRPWTDGR